MIARRFALVALVSLGGAGCRTAAPRFDLELPEASVTVPIEAPLAILVQAAASPEPSLRGRALEVLLRTGSAEELAAWGQVCSLDPSGWVRGRCAVAVGARRDQVAARELLASWTRDDALDPVFRGMTGVFLAGAEPPVAPVEVSWRSEHRPFRRLPLAIAALALGDAEARPVVARDFATGEVPLELDWLRALGELDGLGLEEGLRAAMEQGEPELALPLAEVLARLGDSQGIDYLRHVALGSDEELALESLDALVSIPGPGATAVLRRVAKTAAGEVRAYARMALPARGVGEPRGLLAAAESESIEERILAARFGAELLCASSSSAHGRAVAQQLVASALVDDAASVREQALLPLHPPLSPSMWQLVEARLGDEDTGVRVQAAALLKAR